MTSTSPTTTSPRQQRPPPLQNHNLYPAQSPQAKAFRPVQTQVHPSITPLLSPSFATLYNAQLSHNPAPTNDIHAIRYHYSHLYRPFTNPASGVGGIGETTVPGWNKYPADIPVRVYVPPGETGGERKVWPVHFNFHGGGWATGDLETSAHLSHHICALTPCTVIDISYRLLPECPFPTAIMDALTAVTHILANAKTFSIDPIHFTLGGESSGGTIALILNHLFRDAGLGNKVAGVIVATPTICDLRKYATPSMSPFESMQLAEHTPLLNWEQLKFFDTLKWLSLSSSNHNKDLKRDISWFADALTAPSFEGLSGMTWIATAEADPLRDEGEAYAEKVRDGGNEVSVKRYRGVPHGFMHLDKVLEEGREFVKDVVGEIRKCLWAERQTNGAVVAQGSKADGEADENNEVKQETGTEKEENEKEDEEMKEAE